MHDAAASRATHWETRGAGRGTQVHSHTGSTYSDAKYPFGFPRQPLSPGAARQTNEDERLNTKAAFRRIIRAFIFSPVCKKVSWTFGKIHYTSHSDLREQCYLIFTNYEAQRESAVTNHLMTMKVKAKD